MASLDPSQNLVAIETALEADINLMQWGDSGIGKSAMARQAVNMLAERTRNKESYLYDTNPIIREAVDNNRFEVRFEDVRMAHCDVSDWGLPRVFAEILDERGNIVLVPTSDVGDQIPLDYVHKTTRPDWWPRSDYEGLFVLFLDEVNRGEKYAQNGAMEITAERSLRGRKAPSTMRLLSANNPTSGNFITEELDTAMKARWAHIQVQTNPKDFVLNRSEYLDSISQNIIYAGDRNKNDKVLVKPADGTIDDWSIEDQIEWRPRTWEMQAKLARFIEWKMNRDSTWVAQNQIVLQTLIAGLIGSKNMTIWWQTFQTGEFISLEKILSGEIDYAKIEKLGPDRVAMMTLIIKNGMTDKLLIDPITQRGSNQRAGRLLSFFKELQKHRRELASMLAQHFITQQTNSSFTFCSRLLYSDSDFMEFTREIQNLGSSNAL